MSRRPRRGPGPVTARPSPPPARPQRRGDGIWLYGLHAVAAALANPDRLCRRLLATDEGVDRLGTVPRAIEAELSGRDAIDAMLPPGAVHQGLALLVAPLPQLDVADLVLRAEGLLSCQIVALDQVTDPQNVGAILRSAAAFGALGVMLPDRNAPEETGALAKAASGGLERVPLVRVTNLVRALQELKEGGFWTAGLAADGERTLAEAGLTGRVVLVLGAEGAGLRRLTRENCDHLVRLPMVGDMESLNVSNAAAIALYEMNRR